MMARSRVPATFTALRTIWTAAGLNVIDGPVPSGDFTDAVFLGYDGDPEGDFKAADPQQEWAGIGAKARDEEFDIICAAVVLRGDGTWDEARAAVYDLLGQIEDSLRANPSLSQTPPPFVAEFSPGPLYTEPISNGMQVRHVFTVHVKTRLYTS